MTDLATIEFLKNIDIFNGLDDENLAHIIERMKLKTVPKNNTLIIAGDSSNTLFIIKSGSVNVVASNENGKEVILSTLYAGDIVGELALLDGKPRSADVVTREKCELYTLSAPDFYGLIKNNPDVALQIIKYLCQRVRFTNNIAQSLALMDVYERLKTFLYDTATDMGDGTFVIDKPLTHKEIASHVGSGREIVSRILGELAEGNYITVEHKRITINKKLPKGR